MGEASPSSAAAPRWVSFLAWGSAIALALAFAVSGPSIAARKPGPVPVAGSAS